MQDRDTESCRQQWPTGLTSPRREAMGQGSPFLLPSCYWIRFLLQLLWWIWSSPKESMAVCAHVKTVAAPSSAVHGILRSNEWPQLHEKVIITGDTPEETKEGCSFLCPVAAKCRGTATSWKGPPHLAKAVPLQGTCCVPWPCCKARPGKAGVCRVPWVPTTAFLVMVTGLPSPSVQGPW